MRTVLVILFITQSALLAGAQAVEFEVATVKVNRTSSNDARFPELRNGTLVAENVSLKSLVSTAYSRSPQRIIGPNWLDSDRFDLTGKAPQGAQNSELRPMLQRLLKDRFKVAIHRETKTMQVYNMIVAKSGLKMSPYDPANPLAIPPRSGGSMMKATGTMSEIADKLTSPAGRPVLDKTGVEGRYAFILNYTPLSITSDVSGPPDFFTAVEQQLGLKLQPNRTPIEVLIIDHAERVPLEN